MGFEIKDPLDTPSCLAAKGNFDDFRGGVRAEREPVAHAVGDDRGRAVGFGVKAGPVAVEDRAGADVIGKHELPAVGMAGESDGKSAGGGRVERVRMVGHENGKRIWVALSCEGGNVIVDGGVFGGAGKVVFRNGPAGSENLDGLIADSEMNRLVGEKSKAGGANTRVKLVARLEAVVVSLAEE